MATLTVTKIAKSGISGAVTFAAATGDDSFLDDNADGRMTVLLENTDASNAATVVFKAQDGLFGNLGDLAVSVPAATTAAVPLANLESARVKNIAGATKGYVRMTETLGTIANLKIGVISVL